MAWEPNAEENPSASSSSQASPQVLRKMARYFVSNFLEERHHRAISKAYAGHWDRSQSLLLVTDMMKKHGVTLDAEELERILSLEEEQQLEALVAKLLSQDKLELNGFFPQLQAFMSSSQKVRRALQSPEDAAALQAVLDCDFDADSAGLTGTRHEVLRMALVQAASVEASARKNMFDMTAWGKETYRWISQVGPGCTSVNLAATEKRANVAQASLKAHTDSKKGHQRKVVMNFISENEMVLRRESFAGWKEMFLQAKQDAHIYREVREQIAEADARFQDFRDKASETAAALIMRKASADNNFLLQMVFREWFKDFTSSAPMSPNSKERQDLIKLQAALDNAKKSQAESAQRIIARLIGNSDRALKAVSFAGWTRFCNEYKMDKEMNDTIKRREEQFNMYMSSHSERAKAILKAVTSNSDTALVTDCFRAWVQYVELEKAEVEAGRDVYELQEQFRLIYDHSSETALMGRVIMGHVAELIIWTWMAWKFDVKLTAQLRLYQKKLIGKRRQLQSIQDMFRQFATHMESLAAERDSDDTKAWQEDRQEWPFLPPARISGKNEGSVHLPELVPRRPLSRGSLAMASGVGYGGSLAMVPEQNVLPRSSRTDLNTTAAVFREAEDFRSSWLSQQASSSTAVSTPPLRLESVGPAPPVWPGGGWADSKSQNQKSRRDAPQQRTL